MTNKPDQTDASTAGVHIDKIEGEQVEIGDIVGGDKVAGDKITIEDVRDSAIAPKGGIAINNVAGNIRISYGDRVLLSIPLLLQLVIGAIALGMLFLVLVQIRTLLRRPEPLVGGFTVAVTEFQINGDGRGLAEAEALADDFARAIERNRDRFSDADVVVAHPADLGPIKGQTEAERADHARTLAETLKADVVIYGTIDLDNRRAVINPSFFLNDEEFVGATEATGDYHMGTPLTIANITLNRLRTDAADTFEKRVEALSFLTSGLSDFHASYYADAEAKFNQALAIEAWNTPDIIYVWLGNVALQQQDWTKANDYYLKAKNENPASARAYIGLATVSLNRSRENVPADSYAYDLHRLQEAIDNYQLALTSADQPTTANVSTNVRLGLGEAYMYRALALESASQPDQAEEAYHQAQASFQSIVTDFMDGNEQILWQTAHAHAGLGLMAWQQGQMATARQEYEAAIALLQDADYLRAGEDMAAYQRLLDILNAGGQ